MGKRQDQKEATRAKIMTEAHRLFSHAGYEDVSIRQIAAAAGVSTGAIFANANDKADLFRAAMGEEAPDVRAFLREVVETCIGHSDPRVEALYAKAYTLRRRLIGSHA